MAAPAMKITARVIFEIVGNPKEHVVSSLANYLKTMKQDPEIAWNEEYIGEPEEKDGLWSTFAEITLSVKAIEKLTWLCMNFTPASIEILEPTSFSLSDKNLADWLNDLLARLHEIGLHAKGLTSENDLLKVNINHLIRNSILLTLKHNKRAMSAKEIGDDIGVEDPEALKPFFDAMEKEHRIKKTGGEYHLL